MTKKQRRFVGEYFKDFDPKQAAVRAGYCKANIARESARIMNDPAVSGAIERRRNAADECGTVIGSKETLEHLSNIARDESIPASNRIRALELLGKYHNLFTDRVQFGMSGEFAHLFDEQLEEEILALARKRPKGWTPDKVM